MRDSLFYRMIGHPKGDRDTGEGKAPRIAVHYLIAALTEYAVGQYSAKKLLDIWRPGLTLERQLRALLAELDAEVTIGSKLDLIQQWDVVFMLAEAGHDYVTEELFNKRLGL